MNTNTAAPVAICEHCRTPMTSDPRAPHKRFCSLKCKDAFWRKARKMGEAALAAGDTA